MECKHGCGRQIKYPTLKECRPCYQKRKRVEYELSAGPCINNCGRKSTYNIGNNLCYPCYTKTLKRCTFQDCSNPIAYSGSGLCRNHKKVLDAEGILRPLRALSPRGEGYISSDGYRVLFNPSHPNARKSGHVFEHIVVMSKHIDRPLIEDENVHHINGNRLDNRIENLELWSCSQPRGQRVLDKLRYAKEIISLYGDLERDGLI